MAEQQGHDDVRKTGGSGMIAEESYPWFLGGVLVGGAVIVPVGTTMLMDGITPVGAWIGGIVSAIVFLLCLDKRGNFRWTTAIPAIGVAVVGANVYHQATGRPIAVVGGVLGFVIYAILGAIGVGIGKLVRGKS